MSSHSEKYSSSSFIHHVPMLRKNLKRPMYFYLFLTVSFLYYCHHCGTVHLHPDTILRKHGCCLRCGQDSESSVEHEVTLGIETST